jgi:hypothetical protein
MATLFISFTLVQGSIPEGLLLLEDNAVFLSDIIAKGSGDGDNGNAAQVAFLCCV